MCVCVCARLLANKLAQDLFLSVAIPLKDVHVRSSSVVYVYPPDNPKSSLYYVMQQLKSALPKVVVKVVD